MRDFFDILFRRKISVLAAMAVLAILFGGYLVLMPPAYESRMRILVRNGRAPTVISAEPGNFPAVSADVSDAQFATELQLLSSRGVLQSTALANLLPANVSGYAKEVALGRAVARLEKKLRITPVYKSNLIEVRYTDTDRLRAERVLQGLADAYFREHIALHGSPGTFEFFKSQAETYERQLHEAQEAASDFQKATDIVALREQESLLLKKATDEETALHEVEAALSEATQRIATLREHLSASPGRILTARRTLPNQYSMERLNTLITELRNKRAELLTKFRPDDRMVLQVDQQIANTRAALDEASKATTNEDTTDVNPVHQQEEMELARTEQSYRGLEARSRTLAAHVAGYRSSLRKLASSTERDDELARRVKEAEANYLLYSKKMEEARIGDELDQRKVANVILAEPPAAPSTPLPKVNASLMAAFVLANGIILALIVGSGYLSRTIHTPWELERYTGIPVLATIALDELPVLPAMRISGGSGQLRRIK